MTYTNNINYYTIDYLDLFDDIPFKYVKSIVNQNKTEEDWIEFEFQVEIEDVECNRLAWCATKFTFDLEVETTNGSIHNKTFVVIKEYNTSSPMAMYIVENLYEEDDEDDEEDEDEDEDENEEEMSSAIHAINPIFLEEEENGIPIEDVETININGVIYLRVINTNDIYHEITREHIGELIDGAIVFVEEEEDEEDDEDIVSVIDLVI